MAGKHRHPSLIARKLVQVRHREYDTVMCLGSAIPQQILPLQAGISSIPTWAMLFVLHRKEQASGSWKTFFRFEDREGEKKNEGSLALKASGIELMSKKT